MTGWPTTAPELEAEQRSIAGLAAAAGPWRADDAGAVAVAATFFASPSGNHPSDRAWAAAVVVQAGRTVASAVATGRATEPYMSGLLALREGPLLEEAIRGLEVVPDVVLVDATGRDHPRGAGLALHLGFVLGIPTTGVTDRSLVARPEGEPGPDRGEHVPLLLDGAPVGAVVRTRRGARPVVVHAGWRTDAETAIDVVLACGGRSRTPEPLRRARHVARVTRARDEGRLPPGWADAPLSR